MLGGPDQLFSMLLLLRMQRVRCSPKHSFVLRDEWLMDANICTRSLFKAWSAKLDSRLCFHVACHIMGGMRHFGSKTMCPHSKQKSELP